MNYLKSLRIVTLGTSLTLRGGWQEPLANGLRTCTGSEIEVINLGKVGATSEWGVSKIAEVVAAEPDVLLIEFSANDAALHRGISLQRSMSNIRTIVNSVRERRPDIRIFLMTMSPVTGLRGLVRPFLGTYYESYRSLSEELAVGFIDHRPAWSKLGAKSLRSAMPDGSHPDAKMTSDLIVPTIVEAILPRPCALKKS